MKIKIYTTPTCEWCKKLKEWLKMKKFPYEDYDTTEESEYREAQLKKSGQLAIPVIDIDGEIIIGFDEKKLEKIIESKKS